MVTVQTPTGVSTYDDTDIQAEVDLNTAKITNIAHPTVNVEVPIGAVFTDTVYNDTDIQAEVDLNTAKTSNIAHPLVETAVPSGAVFTDTVYTLTKAKIETELTGEISTHSHAGGGGFTPTVFFAELTAGILTTGAAFVDQLFDSARKDTGYTHSDGTASITLVDAGDYKVHYELNASTALNNRSEIGIRVELDNVVQATMNNYNVRNNAQNEGGLALTTILVGVTSNQVLTLAYKDEGVACTINEARIIVEKV